MKTFASSKDLAAPSGGQSADTGYAAHLQDAPCAVDTSPAALTLQRFGTLANASPQASQFRQQADSMATSPQAMVLQRFQQMASHSPQVLQLKQQAKMLAGASGARQRAMAQPMGTVQRVTDEDVLQGRFEAARREPNPGIVQRIVDVGGTIYKAYSRKGNTPDELVKNVRERATELSVRLRKTGWQDPLRDEVKDPNVTKSYASLDQIVDASKSESQSDKRQREIAEQGRNITRLLTGVDEPQKKRARTIAYESSKTMESVRKHISGTSEFTKTKDELEALTPAKIGQDNEVMETENSAFVFEALDQSDDTKRLDFNFHGTPIVTHGYESKSDRTVDASTLDPFGFGPVKIGAKIGAYRKVRKRGTDIRGPSNRVLTNLEMFRIPQASAMLGLKRDLYEKGEITLEEAMSDDNLKSNVEFLGAVKGSGLLADDKARMQQQQVFSNAHTLDDYAVRFPDYEIGTQTKDNKARATPKEIEEAREKLEKDKDKPSKKAFRKKLKRTIASVMEVEGFNSDSDVSDYDEDDYK